MKILPQLLFVSAILLGDFALASAFASVLTVTKAGIGSGQVTSDPAGIACGATCSATFTDGSVVMLGAAADGNSTFAGWSGCDMVSGPTNHLCTVTMTGDRNPSVNFTVLTQFDVPLEGTQQVAPYVSTEGVGGGFVYFNPATKELSLLLAF